MGVELIVFSLAVILIISLIIEKRIGRHPVIWSPAKETPSPIEKTPPTSNEPPATEEPSEAPAKPLPIKDVPTASNEPPTTEEPSEAPTPTDEENEIPEISIPERIDGKSLAYQYHDVEIIPHPNGADRVNPAEKLSFYISDNGVSIYQGNRPIGEMRKNKLADMVADWQKRGDPFVAYISEYAGDSSSAKISIFFYRDMFAAFMRAHPDAKQYRLTGKIDDFADGYQTGDLCEVQEDADRPGKYEVLYIGSRIGYLPAAAIKYAEESGYDPEELTAYIADVEYDDEKERDIISVYIAGKRA